MKKIKFLSLTLLISSMALFNSCAKEGCTDGDAKNYNVDAKKDDGTCKYEGEVVFWYNKATSDFLVADDAINLTYYVDGVIIGSSATSVYWTSSPDCGQNGSVTVTKDLGSDKMKKYSYRVVDQSGWEYWKGEVEVKAFVCLAQELNK
jgi:hypothetical protein